MLQEIRTKRLVLTGDDPKDRKIFNNRAEKNLKNGWEETECTKDPKIESRLFRKIITVREANKSTKQTRRVVADEMTVPVKCIICEKYSNVHHQEWENIVDQGQGYICQECQ